MTASLPSVSFSLTGLPRGVMIGPSGLSKPMRLPWQLQLPRWLLGGLTHVLRTVEVIKLAREASEDVAFNNKIRRVTGKKTISHFENHYLQLPLLTSAPLYPMDIRIQMELDSVKHNPHTEK